MSWVTVIWSMVVAVCLTMAVPHLVICLRERCNRVNLLFALAAIAVAGIAVGEFAMMRAETPAQIGKLQQLTHLPIFVLVVALVGFVRSYFGIGRRWLGYAAIAIRLVSLAINFAYPPNLNFREVTGIRHLHFLGETVSTPLGVISPWTRLGELSSLLVLVFVLDASVTLWRQNKPEGRRRALVVGGSIVVFILLAAGVSALIHARVLTLPYLISFPFLAIGMAMAFELGYDLFRAAQLAERLQVSEAAVREREARISLAAESANLALWVYDPQEDVTWLSDKGREIFGFTPNERLSADSFRSRIHPDERDLVMSAFQGAQTSPDGFELEHRVVRSEQDTRWVIVRGRSLRDEAGKLLELIGVTIDITAQKKADLENQTHRQEMAHLSRVAVMGEMAGSLAHELNQPLLAIASNASSARRFLERGELERGLLLELLQDISADSQRAGEVIRSVRGFVRKGDGRSELIDLNETVANVARLMRSDLLMRESMVLTELDPKLPMIEGIAVHIQQVLLNLILNALDAMQTLPATKRRVTITTRTVNETKIEVSVRDSGTGLPADKLEKIFEHFYSTKREGMGMGLTIARSIIAAHGGMLEAENAEGGGARFFFRIPVAQEKNS